LLEEENSNSGENIHEKYLKYQPKEEKKDPYGGTEEFSFD
jgi:hypothetical protein